MEIVSSDKYYKPNGISSSYTVYKVGDILISKDESESILAEKYRPRIIEDLVLPSELIKKVKDIIDSGKIPNMLFYSIHGGSGKDSIISVISNGIPIEKLVINASLDRGIDGIRTKVMGFSSTSSLSGGRKVCYLTEAGGMTKPALDSLKTIVENSSDRVSYFMTANSLNNISEPLMTRFQVFDMNTIPEEERKALAYKAYLRIKAILEIEGISYQEKDVQKLLMNTFPSYRKMLNTLERCITNGEFVLEESASVSEVNEIIELINNDDYVSCVKKSMKVEVPMFCNMLSTNYHKGLLKDSKDIVVLIESLNELQIAISENRPFLNVSFLVFCSSLIKNGIKLNQISE